MEVVGLGAGIGMAEVREALRAALVERGYAVASDTLGSRGELHVRGSGDLAAALFEFKGSAREACDTMYQGSWVAGLPPRFGVMPAAATGEPDFELVEQMRVVPLLWTAGAEGAVRFEHLDELLAEHVAAGR